MHAKKGIDVKRALPIIIGLTLLAGALLACGGSSDTNTGTKANPSNSATKQAPAQKFKQGDVVKVGDTWEVTINSFKTFTSDNQFEQPKDGYMFVDVNVTIKNISAKEDTTNPYDFSLRGGADGTKYDSAIVDVTSASGKIEPGDQQSGDLAYEVKSSEKTFILSFEPNAFSGGQTQWELSL